MSSLLEHIDQDYNSGQEDDDNITSSDEDQNGRDYVTDDDILQFNPKQTAETEKGLSSFFFSTIWRPLANE